MKGMSLAINQVVLIIIGVVILGLGIFFVGKIFATAEYQLPSVDARLEAELQNALTRNAPVDIPRSTRTVGAKELGIIHLGILHDPAILIPPSTSERSFYTTLSFNKAISKRGVAMCTSTQCQEGIVQALLLDPDFSYQTNEQKATYSIQPNEVQAIPIGFVAKENPSYAGPGQYIFQTCVCYDGACTDGTSPDLACTPSNYEQFTNAYGYATFSFIVE